VLTPIWSQRAEEQPSAGVCDQGWQELWGWGTETGSHCHPLIKEAGKQPAEAPGTPVPSPHSSGFSAQRRGI
jgi:hypothetical protein